MKMLNDKKLIHHIKLSPTIRCRCPILPLIDLAYGQTCDYEECATVTGSCVATVSNTVKTFCIDDLEKRLVLERNVNLDTCSNLYSCGVSCPQGESRERIFF